MQSCWSCTVGNEKFVEKNFTNAGQFAKLGEFALPKFHAAHYSSFTLTVCFTCLVCLACIQAFVYICMYVIIFSNIPVHCFSIFCSQLVVVCLVLRYCTAVNIPLISHFISQLNVLAHVCHVMRNFCENFLYVYVYMVDYSDNSDKTCCFHRTLVEAHLWFSFSGDLADWFSQQPDILQAVLPMILDGLTTPSLSASAALSFKYVCGECRKLLGPLAGQLVQRVQVLLLV